MEKRENSFKQGDLGRFGQRAAERVRKALQHEGRSSAIATALLALVVICGPLPFASVTPMPRAWLQIASFLALAAAFWAHPTGRYLGVVRWPLTALAGVATIGVAQSLPWPRAIAHTLSSRIASQWDQAAYLVGEAPPQLVPLSIAPEVSRHTALHLLAIAACLAAAALQGRERASRRLIAICLFAGAVFQILYGAQAGAEETSRIWGVEVPGDPGRLRGTFVNPDHFALYQSMALALTAGWLWWALRRILNRDRKSGPESHLVRAAPPVLLFGILFVGLAFSGSRAGLIAGIAALIIQGQVLALRARRWQWGLTAIGAVTLGVGALGLFGWRRGLDRWLSTSAYEIGWNARLGAWRETFDLWWHSPWLGTGLGTFRQAFPLEQPSSLPGTWHHAHSDVLELLATVGPIGWLLLALALGGISRRLWLVIHKGRRSEDRAAALGTFGVVAAVGLHSCADFGLTTPANAFTLAVIVGLGCGARLLKSPPPREPQSVFLDPDAPSQPYRSTSRSQASPGVTSRPATVRNTRR